MTYAGSAEENTAAVAARMGLWSDFDDLRRDHVGYVGSRMTFTTLLASGRRAFTEGRTADAVDYFNAAREMRGDHYEAWFFMGMISHNARNFAEADRYFALAIDLGADAPLVLFSRAVNAAMDGRTADAILMLRLAADADPARFGESARAMIAQLETAGVAR